MVATIVLVVEPFVVVFTQTSDVGYRNAVGALHLRHRVVWVSKLDLFQQRFGDFILKNVSFVRVVLLETLVVMTLMYGFVSHGYPWFLLVHDSTFT